MHRLMWSSCLVLSISAGALRAADEPRALVERAINALGGREVLARKPALFSRLKGSLGSGGLSPKVELKGRLYADAGGRSRVEMDLEVGEDRHELISVSNGSHSWRRMDGEVAEVGPEEVKDQEASAHRDRILALLPLLEDSRFRLTSLGEVKVEGRPARGVKVSFKGQADVNVYFDCATGLIVKYSYKQKETGDSRTFLHEVLPSDYQEIGVGPAEERVLKGAGVDLTGSGLLEYLRKQAPDPGRLARARELVKRLGDDSFAVRDRASRELVALGPVALPLLQEAARASDLEVARRAAHCLRKISHSGPPTVLMAAVRLAAVRRAAGTAAALLSLLPTDDADLNREIKAALYALAQQGNPDPALVQALADKDPARRAAAAAALGKDGGAYRKEPGQRLYGRLPKQAMKMLSYRGGEREFELTTIEVEAFNRFEDRLFARP